MSTYAIIQSLLDTQLQSLSGLPPLQLENTVNIGKTGVSFSRATLLPAAKSQASVGISGQDLIRGIYQVDLFVPQDTGSASVNALADSVVDHFPRGLALASGEVVVHINTASRLTGGRMEPFYSVPVQVQWSCIA